jgi:hypothetical protein
VSSQAGMRRGWLLQSASLMTRSVHFAVVAFVILGWSLPNISILKFHIFFLPIVVLHWQTNGGTCFLTNIETWLDKKIIALNPKTETVAAKNEQGRFVRSLLSYINIEPTDRQLKKLIYVAIFLSWLFGLSHWNILSSRH